VLRLCPVLLNLSHNRLSAPHKRMASGMDCRPSRIEGAATPQGFRIVSKGGPFIASATLTSNSLWTPAMLEQTTVVDAQRGGVIGVSARSVAVCPLRNTATLGTGRIDSRGVRSALLRRIGHCLCCGLETDF
jgi:hypothetical protein